ncbi:hypothetical protein MUP79_03410 [Candidatus Bathyarchaeota archaeon]|nr:hypothetical protein [Candidatus Bathyarchaeota archaeon]
MGDKKAKNKSFEQGAQAMKYMHRPPQKFQCEECKSIKIVFAATSYQCLACGFDGVLPPSEIGKKHEQVDDA